MTAVANAHTERVWSIDGVAQAKRELIEALPKAGVAILNRDDDRVWAMRSATEATVLSFGASEHADVRMVKCTIDDQGRATASVASPWGEVELKMQVAGRHMAHNALAALCVAGALGIDMGAAASAISSAKISEFRMQMRKLQSGATVIDDSYNANPASMRAALETLASINAKRKVAFCGLMAELAESASEHRSIRQYATELGIELIAVNTDLYDVDAVSFDQARDLLAKLSRDDAALVKGSKVTGLVRLC